MDLTTASASLNEKISAETERLKAELGFGRFLCGLHPEKSLEWSGLIAKAEENAVKAFERGDPASIRKTIEDSEKSMAEIGQAAKSFTVHCAGHGHIDMNWMWSWPETVAVTVDTFVTVLKLMEEFPDFKFSQSQASVYAIMEEYRPDMLAAIAERVREGRWEVTASHWVEGDKNMAGAESLCRQVLYTRRYMERLFGLKPEDVPIDWSPDTFGHPATVPSYLTRSGIRYLYLHRPGTMTLKKPWVFWWQGPDGSRVLVRNDSNALRGYNGEISPLLIRDLERSVSENGLKDHLFVYGVGDHGGGPTRRDIESAIEMDRWPVFPNIRFSTVKKYFETVAPLCGGLPVLDRELNFEFTGCYTSQSLIKKMNRYGENRLIDAEFAASVSWLTNGLAFPRVPLEAAWKNILFNQFHDILPGSGVMETRTFSHGLYQKSMAATSQVETRSLRSLASLIDTFGAGLRENPGCQDPAVKKSLGAGSGMAASDGSISRADRSSGSSVRPFLLFNPVARDSETVVEAVVWDQSSGDRKPLSSKKFNVQAPDGTVLPAQTVETGSYWGHDYAALAFPAVTAGLGYSVYTIFEDGMEIRPDLPKNPDHCRHLSDPHHCAYAANERGREGLENGLIRLEIDPRTGGIRSLAEKKSGVEIVSPETSSPVLEYEVERPHAMTAWAIEHPGTPAEYPEVTDIRRTRQGPWSASLQISFRIRESEFSLTYETRFADPRLFINIKGTWFQRGTPRTGVPALSFALPLSLDDARCVHEIPFGSIERGMNNREEVPSQQWTMVRGSFRGKAAGALVMNDSKYGHSLEANKLRISLIRGSYDPDILPEIGRHEVKLAVLPFCGDMPVCEAVRRGQEFNRPVKIIGTDLHQGPLPGHGRFLKIDPPEVVLSCLKKAEDSDSLIFRLFNTAPKELVVRIELGLSLGSNLSKPVETDLMERPVENSSAVLEGRTIKAKIPAFGIATVKVDAASNRTA